ncbi:MAG: helix-turn-helix transcriptional regulator [Ilumatobacteraceae bacterium]
MADRVERLTNLLALLLETRRPLTLHEIASELEGQYPDAGQARRAAFERDKAALREIGVEISTETFGGDRAGEMGYRIERSSFELPDLGLTDDEVRALQVALAATRPDSAIGEEALLKLGGVGGGVGGPIRMHLPELPALPILRSAVAQRHPVLFRYSGNIRKVEPWGLLLRDGFWYVVGFDQDRRARRTFRVDRCEGEVAIDSAIVFDPPADGDVGAALPTNPLLLGDELAAEREAVVHIAARRAWLVEREIGSERILVRHDDGSITIRLPFTNEDALRSWVLGFLDDAELLEPVDVRDRLIEWLRAAV